MIEVIFNADNEITSIEAPNGLTAEELEQIGTSIQEDPVWLQSPADRKTDLPTTVRFSEEEVDLAKNKIPKEAAEEIVVILDEILDQVGETGLGYHSELAKTELETNRQKEETKRLLQTVVSLAEEGGYNRSIEDMAQLAQEHAVWATEGFNHSVELDNIPEHVQPEHYKTLCPDT